MISPVKQQQSIFITGANRGIGLEFVRSYAKNGWTVYAACRSPEDAADLRGVTGKVEVLRLDVTREDDMAKAAAQLAGCPIDIVVNNAAIHGPRDACGTFGNIDVEAWIEVMKVNAMAPVKVTEALFPNLLLGQHKKLVYISSRAGSISERGSQSHHRTGGPYIYRTSKAALNAAVKAIGYDLRGQGVSVVALHPGWVKTETGGWDAPGEPADSVASMRKLIERATPEANGVLLDVDGSVIPW